MTNTPGGRELAAQIEALSADLQQAKNDLALYDRLKAAAMQVKALTAALATATAQHKAAVAQEEMEMFEAEMANFLNIAISAEHAHDNPLRNNYCIAVTRISYTGNHDDGEPQTTTYTGFDSLPPSARLYLVHKRPDAIPPAIRRLGDDPDAAIGAYLAACRRGYVASPAADSAQGEAA